MMRLSGLNKLSMTPLKLSLGNWLRLDLTTRLTIIQCKVERRIRETITHKHVVRWSVRKGQQHDGQSVERKGPASQLRERNRPVNWVSNHMRSQMEILEGRPIFSIYKKQILAISISWNRLQKHSRVWQRYHQRTLNPYVQPILCI